MKTKLLLSILLPFLFLNQSAGQIPYPGENPGLAKANTESDNRVILENNVLSMEFVYSDNKIRLVKFEDVAGNYKLQIDSLPFFELRLQNGISVTSEDFSLTDQPDIKYSPH